MRSVSSAKNQASIWRAKIRGNLSYNVQSCAQRTGSEKQQSPNWTRGCLLSLVESLLLHSERANIGADMGIQFKNIVSGHNIQQWRKLLCSAANKASLIKFLVEEWKWPEHRDKLQGKTLYVTCEEVCFKITKDQWEEVTQLRSSQEEADTRIILHALPAAESGYKAAIIIADDTDVLVLSLGFSKDIPCPVYQQCGT